MAPTFVMTWSWVDPDATPAVPIITGATSVTGQAYDYTATFTKGTAKTFSATGLTAVTWASAIDGEYKTSANITVSNGTATIAASNWGSAAAGDKRFLKLTVGEETYIVQVTIATA